MGTLYIDRKDVELRLDGDAIAFYTSSGRDGMVPVKPLKRVVISGRILVDTGVLHKLADENISVIFLSGKRQKFKGRLSGRIHNNGYLRIKQYERVSTPFAFKWACELVSAKLTAQRSLLTGVLKRRPDCRRDIVRALETIENSLNKIEKIETGDVGRLRGLEGGAASAYFSAYTALFPQSLGFTKRVRRPPEDPANAMLSLTYTMLHWEGVREVEIMGLDPLIGYFHDFEYGRESLACDIIEPFRPLVDGWIWYLFRQRIFTSRDFTTGKERPGCYLKKGGRKRYYELYEDWVRNIRSQLVIHIRELARRILEDEYGQDNLS